MHANPRFRPGLAALLLTAAWAATAADARLVLQPGDRIVFAGNTFAERQRHFGYFETLLTARHPELGLTFRNLGWSADEVDLQPRPMDFGGMDHHLAGQAASVVFLCFGFNESFRGEAALPAFIDKYKALLDRLGATSHDGREPSRPVVVAPIRTEPLPRGLRSPEHEHLGRYSEAIRELATAQGIPCIDLYKGVATYREANGISERFTFNGIHLTEFGDYHIAQAMLKALGMDGRPHALHVNAAQNRAENFFLGVVEDLALSDGGGTLDLRWDRLPAPPPPGMHGAGAEPLGVRISGLAPASYRLHWDGAHAAEHSAEDLAQGVHLAMTPAHAAAEELRRVIIDKNQLFFDRWRAVNGYYIYGGRKQPFGIESFPPEMDRFDALVMEREQEIRERVSGPLRATLTIEAIAP